MEKLPSVLVVSRLAGHSLRNAQMIENARCDLKKNTIRIFKKGGAPGREEANDKKKKPENRHLGREPSMARARGSGEVDGGFKLRDGIGRTGAAVSWC